MTMKLSLRPDIEQFVQEQIKAGKYDSADDMVNGALLLLKQQQDDLSPAEIQTLKAEIGKGLAEADRGELEDWDVNEIRAEGRRLLDESRKVR
jgi:antitoxin ParD1/3/4